jgi:phage terminase large subunit-like protein
MTKSNWILTYYQKVKNGSVVVGHWIELILEYIVNGLQEKAFFYDQKKANEAIDWIEAHAFHTEGPLAPQPLKLELWEKAFVASIYGIVDEKGFRQFREVVLIVARKNGKSLLASAIAKYEWWCGGYGSKIYNIAPKLAQADIIYNNIWQMTLLDPEYQELKLEVSEKDAHNKSVKDTDVLPRHRMTDLFIPAQNAMVTKIAFSAKKSDGFNPSLCICDEVAAWDGDGGLKQYEVMKSGMGARPEAILLSCSTAGYINDGIYDELLKRSTRLLSSILTALSTVAECSHL